MVGNADEVGERLGNRISNGMAQLAIGNRKLAMNQSEIGNRK
jgi:hypothetical protein